MNRTSYLQYAIIAADTAELLTNKLNAELYRLRGKNPSVTFDGMISHVSYYETEDAPETLADEYEALGVHLTCEDCPYFCPMVKADGTLDLRAKWGGCRINEYGSAKKTSPVCDELFKRLNNGEVRLCLSTE